MLLNRGFMLQSHSSPVIEVNLQVSALDVGASKRFTRLVLNSSATNDSISNSA